MKNLILITIVAIALISCKKGNDYCEPPQEMKGFKNIYYFSDSTKKVEVVLDYSQLFNDDQKDVLFSFSTPSVFINPKADGRTEDVTSSLTYQYQLKDPSSPPDSVKISAYAFNDCGESEIVSTWLRF